MTERHLDYIDNIRILLTAVVLMNHLSITYGAPGGWYYTEFETTQLSIIPMAVLVMFAAANQAYSMGFFFFISGYFSARSISHRNSQTFLSQRLVRLGIPILLFVYVISPILQLSFRWVIYDILPGFESVVYTYKQIEFGRDLGPMWFIMLLLIFSILLIVFQNNLIKFSSRIKIPYRYITLLAAFIVGFLTFLVRVQLPVGTVYKPLNLQIPHLVQYIFMFFIGALSYSAGWEKNTTSISLKFWFPFTIGLIIAMPIIFYLVGGASGNVTSALGGFTWQSLVFSLWEMIFCVSMTATLLGFFSKFFDKGNKITRELASSSYATYIFHPLILVIFTALLQEFQIPPLLKITYLAFPTLVVCFFTASLLRRLPGLNSIL